MTTIVFYFYFFLFGQRIRCAYTGSARMRYTYITIALFLFSPADYRKDTHSTCDTAPSDNELASRRYINSIPSRLSDLRCMA